MPGSDDLSVRLNAALSEAERELLDRAVALCAERSDPVYLIGGGVRDLLLGRRGVDLDLALEGATEPVATALATATGGRVVTHGRFGTAAVRAGGARIDLARTRRERYVRPGALPEVEPAGLEEDLARRDFTVNAMALRLWPAPVELIDRHGGRDDLAAGRIRVLHDRSFQDDATRMLRAVRYAARLGFKIERSTEKALRRDLAYADTVSGPRLRRELILLLGEPACVAAARLGTETGVLAAVHPALGLDPAVAEGWQSALDGKRQAPQDELGLCLIANPADLAAVASIAGRLHLGRRFERAIRDLVRLRPIGRGLVRNEALPSEAVEFLDGFAPAAIWALSLLDTAFAKYGQPYLETWRHVKPGLSGHQLQALGLSDGPIIGDVLRALRRARLDGMIDSAGEEFAIAMEIISEQMRAALHRERSGT
jgi:tRNA nucleotidyltransferase (CCA-adding enzyme)